MTSVFPLELYSLIIDHADRSDLPNISLVCKPFSVLGQAKLHQRVKLKPDHTSTMHQLLGLSQNPHLAKKIKSLEIGTGALASATELEEFGLLYEAGANSMDATHLKELVGRVSKLTIRLGAVLQLCAHSLEELVIVGSEHIPGHDNRAKRVVIETSLMSILEELICIYKLPSVRVLVLSSLWSRSFTRTNSQQQYFIDRTEPNSRSIFLQLFPQLKRFELRECSDYFDVESACFIFFTELVPVAHSLHSLSINNNRGFIASLSKLATQNSGSLTQLFIMEAVILSGLRTIIKYSPNLLKIHLEKIELNPRKPWSNVFKQMMKLSNLQSSNVLLRHLNYWSRSYNNTSYESNFDLHDSRCGSELGTILCCDNYQHLYSEDKQTLHVLQNHFEGSPMEVTDE